MIITHSPITRTNHVSINLVSIFRCFTLLLCNPVYVRRVDPSALTLSLWSHRLDPPEYVDKLIIWSLQLTSKPMETPPPKKRGKQVGTNFFKWLKFIPILSSYEYLHPSQSQQGMKTWCTWYEVYSGDFHMSIDEDFDDRRGCIGITEPVVGWRLCRHSCESRSRR